MLCALERSHKKTTGHGGPRKMVYYLKGNHVNTSRPVIQLFLNTFDTFFFKKKKEEQLLNLWYIMMSLLVDRSILSNIICTLNYLHQDRL